MINSGKCPKCDKPVAELSIETLTAKTGMGLTGGYAAMTLCCPFCRTVLGAALDPLAIKTDTVNAVLRGLKGR